METRLSVWGGLVAGAVIGVGFGVVEFRRGRQPLLEVRLFADPNFATGVAAIVVLFGATPGRDGQRLRLVRRIVSGRRFSRAGIE